MIPKHFEGIVTEFHPAHDTRLKRGEEFVGIIIHHTDIGTRDPEKVDDATWRELFKNITKWLTLRDTSYLSAHFHIGRFGECAMLANPDSYLTFHAGVSEYYHPLQRKLATGWNSHSIGIELLGDGNKGPYSDAQYRTLSRLCAVLVKRYPTIDPRCIVGHENLSPKRKSDPGFHFKWWRLHQEMHQELERLKDVILTVPFPR